MISSVTENTRRLFLLDMLFFSFESIKYNKTIVVTYKSEVHSKYCCNQMVKANIQ